MKVAIPTQNNMISRHFGHCESIIIIEIDADKRIISKHEIKNGCQISALLDYYEVETVIVSKIGKNAKTILHKNNINVLIVAYGLINNIFDNYIFH